MDGDASSYYYHKILRKVFDSLISDWILLETALATSRQRAVFRFVSAHFLVIVTFSFSPVMMKFRDKI